MRQGKSRELLEYWNRLRAGRPAPRREEVEPSDIRHLLSDTFILEISGTMKTVSYRLAGTRLCAAFGRELKGYGFLGHWAEEDCFEIAKLLTRVYREFEPQVVIMTGETASGKTVDYEYIIVPLEPMADGSARVMGIGTPCKDHYWLGAEPLVNCRLRYARAIAPNSIRSRNGEMSTINNTPPLAPSLTPVEELPGEGTPRNFYNSAAGLSENGVRKVAHLTVHDGGRE